jgi:aminomethyltransferase
MALARLSLTAAVAGAALEVRTAGGPVPAVAHALPFYDPDKARRTAVG